MELIIRTSSKLVVVVVLQILNDDPEFILEGSWQSTREQECLTELSDATPLVGIEFILARPASDRYYVHPIC